MMKILLLTLVIFGASCAPVPVVPATAIVVDVQRDQWGNLLVTKCELAGRVKDRDCWVLNLGAPKVWDESAAPR